ncbi:hypothetical protein ES705_10411 [subsurface metagenome]|nr:hypothetical protein [Clostridia bacterium]
MKKLFMTMLLFSFVVSLTWGESGKVTEEEKGKQVISSNKSDFEVTFSSVSSNGTKAKVAETKVKESLDQIKTISPSYKGESYHERGRVWTKTYKIAFFWNKKSLGGAGSPNLAELKKILDSEGIPIGIVTYGAVADFADDYYIVVKQSEEIIYPILKGGKGGNNSDFKKINAPNLLLI